MKRGFRNLLLVLLLGCAAACSRSPTDDCASSERVVDPVLLAFLSQARSAHHVADQHESSGDTAAALRPLQALVGGPKPPDAPEAAEVLADTRARIADLLSRSGRFDQAEEHVNEGLTNARESSYFRGHLLEVLGLVEERRAQALSGTGRAEEAEKARQRSLAAYEEAMRIQAEVIQRARPAGTGAPTP